MEAAEKKREERKKRRDSTNPETDGGTPNHEDRTHSAADGGNPDPEDSTHSAADGGTPFGGEKSTRRKKDGGNSKKSKTKFPNETFFVRKFLLFLSCWRWRWGCC